jgi:hypothetical protein
MDPSKIEKQFKTRSFEWYSLDRKAMIGAQSHPNHLPTPVTIMNFHQSHLSSHIVYPLVIKHGWLENPMFLKRIFQPCLKSYSITMKSQIKSPCYHRVLQPTDSPCWNEYLFTLAYPILSFLLVSLPPFESHASNILVTFFDILLPRNISFA